MPPTYALSGIYRDILMSAPSVASADTLPAMAAANPARSPLRSLAIFAATSAAAYFVSRRIYVLKNIFAKRAL